MHSSTHAAGGSACADSRVRSWPPGGWPVGPAPRPPGRPHGRSRCEAQLCLGTLGVLLLTLLLTGEARCVILYLVQPCLWHAAKPMCILFNLEFRIPRRAAAAGCGPGSSAGECAPATAGPPRPARAPAFPTPLWSQMQPLPSEEASRTRKMPSFVNYKFVYQKSVLTPRNVSYCLICHVCELHLCSAA